MERSHFRRSGVIWAFTDSWLIAWGHIWRRVFWTLLNIAIIVSAPFTGIFAGAAVAKHDWHRWINEPAR